METKVYYLDVNLPIFDEKDHTELTNDEFIDLAETYGNVYSLEGFQDALNSEEFNPVHYWIRIIKTESYYIESVDNLFRSVFPESESENSQLHEKRSDAFKYIFERYNDKYNLTPTVKINFIK